MPTYYTPGVYVEEIASLPGSIVAVPTAVPAFIGFTETGAAHENIPYRIESLADYEAVFGGPNEEEIEFDVDDTNAGPVLASRKIVIDMTARKALNMYYQLQMYFANGGGACYIVSVGDYTADPVIGDYVAALWTNLEKVDEITLLVFPDPPYDTANSKVDLTDYGTLVQSALTHCNKMGDRFTIIDTVDTTEDDPITWDEMFRTAMGSLYLDCGAAYYPDLKTTLTYHHVDANITFNAWKINSITQTATALMPVAGTLSAVQTANDSLYRAVKAAIADIPVVLSPCGAIAGVYCRTDRERGVWKAPANTGISQIIGPAKAITDAVQDGLNVDPVAGKSINVIRAFTGKGTLVWGARTLDGNSSEWRYVPVRRLFLMMEESIKNATEFAVFEPNDASTWIRVKSMIENFLNNLWRQGALAGAKPEQAYQVRVGLNVTMTPLDILEGRLIIEVAVAAVRPAEFIVLRFSHHVLAS
jgi:phage tail sheath protein FI